MKQEVGSRVEYKTRIQSFKDLDAWKEGHRLVLTIYGLTKKFPHDELFGLTSQMRRAAVSITSNIAEGFGRSGFKEKAQFYFIAHGSVTELQNQLLIAKDVGYLNALDFARADAEAMLVHKIMTGLIRSTRNRISSKALLPVLLIGMLLTPTSYFILPTPVQASVASTKAATGNGLIGWWSLDENIGTIAHDKAGTKNATLTGTPTWTSGNTGRALTFGATNNYATAATSWPSTGGSISLWAYPTSYSDWISPAGWKLLGTNNGYILLDEGGAGSPGKWRAVFNPNVTSGPGEQDVVASANITQNTWQHLVFTWSKSGSTYTTTFYVNGVYQGTASWTGTAGVNGVGNFHFGNSGDYPDNYFKGKVDEVRVYNRALTQADVTALYRTSAATVKPAAAGGLSGTLVGKWSFDTSTVTGSSVADLSGSGHAMTLVNSPSIITGENAQAVSFNGSNQYGVAQVGSFPSNVAISLWVKASSLTEQSVLAEQDGGSPGAGYHFDLIGIRGGAFYAGFWNIGDIASSAITTGTWYHLILTYNGTANTQSFYVNGVLQGTQSGTWSPPGTLYLLPALQQQSCSFTSASGNCADLAAYFNGAIDDLQVYNQAFGSADVNALNASKATTAASSATLTNGSTLKNGLAGLWTFDGSTISGTSVTDLSGNGNTGTLSGATKPTPVIGKLGQALNFDGSTSYVNAGTSSTLAPSSFTTSAWVYPTSYSNAFARVLQQGTGDGSGNGGFDIEYDSGDGGCGDKTLYGVVWNGQNATRVCPSAGALTLNKWHYVVFSYNGTSGTLYLDGAAGVTTTAVMTTATPTVFNIGRDTSGGSVFPGKIDDVRVYSRVLTAAEALQLYNLGK